MRKRASFVRSLVVSAATTNDVVKNAHYLLAETYSEMGREDSAEEHYEALSSYYPSFPALKSQ